MHWLGYSLAVLTLASCATSPVQNEEPFAKQSVNSEKCIEKVTQDGVVTTCPKDLSLPRRKPEVFGETFHCWVKFDVNTDGSTRNTSIVYSRGFAAFTRTCVETPRQWTFTTPRDNQGNSTIAPSVIASLYFTPTEAPEKNKPHTMKYDIMVNFSSVAKTLDKPDTAYIVFRNLYRAPPRRQ